jgi:RpiB/LacA/LacB family sugar-phosphate isomerase
VTTAGLARRHNDANVVCLGGRTTGTAVAFDAVDAFFSTEYVGGRHQRRLDEIARYESSGAVPAPTSHDHERQQPTP